MVDSKELVLVFDDSVKERIIKSLGFSLNEKEELMDTRGKIATSQDFKPIYSKEFGGLLRGSKIPIRKKESELVKYFLLERS
ncbi:TPA: hypothetical protein HA242_03340 [Candidatus Woesearchaeota archaeon]|nr:hypothetical protein [Candidatus Woesearchaeota archaeon]HIG92844.1 hypothetical protein [Candidatus Woesearchaeota archaeon]HIH12731.1 hypothetical protein [Candidatus Woesearchaeota archaeon]